MNWALLTNYIPLFLLVGAGFVLGTYGAVSISPLSKVILFLAIPALVIDSIGDPAVQIPWAELPAVFTSVTLIVGGGYAFLRGLHASGLLGERGSWQTSDAGLMLGPVMFMSYAHVTLPLADASLGSAGLKYALLVYISGATLTYTLGVALYSPSRSLAAIFRLPLVYALVAALALRLLGVQLPGPIDQAVGSAAAMAKPLILVAIGLQVARLQLSHLRLGLGGGFLRICAGGLLGILAASVVPHVMPFASPMSVSAKQIVCMTAMLPSAAINTIFADYFSGADAAIGSELSTHLRAGDVVDSVVISSYILFAFFGTQLVMLLFR